jgi:putative hydrolase of the HAD superfamily
MDNLFIFDLDDTLIECQRVYNQAILKYVHYVVEHTGPGCPSVGSIMRIYEAIDHDNLEVMGASRQRLPLSMKAAYHNICNQMGLSNPADEEAVKLIGESVFDLGNWGLHSLYPGAAKTLDYLAYCGDALVLYSMGDLEVQEAKIKATGMMRWFTSDNIHIKMTKKTAEDLIGLSKGYDMSHVFVVGNSISDIEPAIKAEAGAIYIPNAQWHLDRDAAKLSEYPRLRKFKLITEIIDNYGNITNPGSNA